MYLLYNFCLNNVSWEAVLLLDSFRKPGLCYAWTLLWGQSVRFVAIVL